MMWFCPPSQFAACNMRKIICKLPFKLRERWRARAHDIMEASGDRAHFGDVVAFIERHVRILSDPIFGDIDAVSPKPVTLTTTNKFKLQPKSGVKGSSFATTITPMDSVENKATVKDAEKQEVLSCPCCSRAHTLEKCQQFKGKKHRDKIQFLKEKSLCFGCLCAGHMSRACNKRMICEVCDKQHPTVLHLKRISMELEQAKETPGVKSSALPQTCGRTGAGEDRCILSIVPVQVKSTKGDEVVQTYAFFMKKSISPA